MEKLYDTVRTVRVDKKNLLQIQDRPGPYFTKVQTK